MCKSCNLPLMYTSVTRSCFSTCSTSTWTHGLKYSNLSLVVNVLGGCSKGSVGNRKSFFSVKFSNYFIDYKGSVMAKNVPMVLDMPQISSGKRLLPICSHDEMLSYTAASFTKASALNHHSYLLHFWFLYLLLIQHKIKLF